MSRQVLQKITDHVWVFKANARKYECYVGVVCSPTQTVLYDAGNSPDQAHRIQVALEGIDAPPVSHIVYSHHHWDHVFGAMAWDVSVIAHERIKPHFESMQSLDWGPEYLAQLSKDVPPKEPGNTVLGKLIDWETFRIVPPTIYFSEKKHVLSMDGLTLELEHVGGRHADESVVLRVVEDNVLFIGDCLHPTPPTPENPVFKPSLDLELMQTLIDKGLDYYVDGHNGPLTPQRLLKLGKRYQAL